MTIVAMKRAASAEAIKMARMLLDMGEVQKALDAQFYAGILEGDAQAIEAQEERERNVSH